ncbi:MAG: hypothetical protein Q7S66_02275 [bacterium]|nr:hypothetical protein [bacterium]
MSELIYYVCCVLGAVLWEAFGLFRMIHLNREAERRGVIYIYGKSPWLVVMVDYAVFALIWFVLAVHYYWFVEWKEVLPRRKCVEVVLFEGTSHAEPS